MKNRAYQREQAAKKFDEYTAKIQELIGKVRVAPLETDYSGELAKLYTANSKDKGIIRLAEQEAYISVRETTKRA